MSKKLEILKNSLAKKQDLFDAKLAAHYADVRQANGQPLNDKRNGRATIDRWDRQTDAIRDLQESIQKTEKALEREQNKIANVELEADRLPDIILDMVRAGNLNQWRKFPNRFFVPGVEKARIIWNHETQELSHSYLMDIPTREQYATFRDVFNNLKAQLNAKKTMTAQLEQNLASR